MDVFFPKFLVQALRKRAERKLGGRERRGGRVAAQGGGGAGKEERAALAAALLVDGLRLERADRLARKRKRRFNVRVRRLVDFVLGDLQEGLPHAKARVEERHADVGVRPVRAHGAERGLHFFVVVIGDWERSRLCLFCEIKGIVDGRWRWRIPNDDMIAWLSVDMK